MPTNRWLEGYTRSGKTAHTIDQTCHWLENDHVPSDSVLVFTADSHHRQQWERQLLSRTKGRYSVTTTTPLSFCRDQVELYWSLLLKRLPLKPVMPMFLRIENEQTLAKFCWADLLTNGELYWQGIHTEKLVRRLLDWFLLGAYSSLSLTEIWQRLQQGLETELPPETWQTISQAMTQWRDFCWNNGLLSYGILTDLFGQHLLRDPIYQKQLRRQYRYVVVDNADEMPALVAQVCQILMDDQASSMVTFNPHGMVRLGLGADPVLAADPTGWGEIYHRSNSELLPTLVPSLSQVYSHTLTNAINYSSQELPEPLPNLISINTDSRAELLRQIVQVIAHALETEAIAPHEIAIIAPGIDPIGNYALLEMLRRRQIPTRLLKDNRPLIFYAEIRALLALMALVYPHLGLDLRRDAIAEMLCTLSDRIDPVRAGMLADHCFMPHPDKPQLLPPETYPQWNRFGSRVTNAYNQIREWISAQSLQIAPLIFLDRSMRQFYHPRNPLPETIAALQALIETAQSHWQMGYRLNWSEAMIRQEFMIMLQQGTVTANPYQHQPIPPETAGIVVATIYQYRMSQLSHRWHIWLDVASPLWQMGGATELYGAAVLRQSWDGSVWTADQAQQQDQERLQRLLNDLLARVEERIYLGFSEIDIRGETQSGLLQCLEDYATPWVQMEAMELSYTEA